MSREWLRLAVAPIVAAAVLAFPGAASAHHTSVSCVEKSTSSWLIVNSEALTPMTFTSPQGVSGSIPGGEGMKVVFEGSTLTIDAVWSNGVTNSSTGVGDCIPDPVKPSTPVDTPPSTTVTPTTSTFPPDTPPLTPPPYIPQPSDTTTTSTLPPIVPEETVPPARPAVPPGQLPATGAVADGLVTMAMLITIVGVLVLGTTYLPRLMSRRRR